MRISFSVDEESVRLLLSMPEVEQALESAGIKNVALVAFSESGISVKATAAGQRAKIKCGLGAQNRALMIDIRDVRIRGISVGGGWVENLVPRIAGELPKNFSIASRGGALNIECSLVGVKAAGIASDGRLFVILEIGENQWQ